MRFPKTLAFVTTLLLCGFWNLPAPSAVLIQKTAAACSEPSYLLEESFEATGYDYSTWDTTTNVDPDYASGAAPLAGTYSGRIGVQGVSVGNLTEDFNQSTQAVLCVAGQIYLPTDPTNNNEDGIFEFLGDEVEVCKAWIRQAYDGVALKARGGTQVVYNNVSPTIYGNTFRFKLCYTLATYTCDMWWTDSTTDWGTVDMTDSGTSPYSTNVDTVELSYASNMEMIVDNLKIANADIPICALD